LGIGQKSGWEGLPAEADYVEQAYRLLQSSRQARRLRYFSVTSDAFRTCQAFPRPMG